jgi:hypothetical protein
MTGGTSARPSSTSRSAWRLQRRWAIGRGKAGPRHLPHALERVRQSRRLPQRTTCLGNIAKVAHVQAHTALNMGVALMLHVRAARQAPTTGADQDKASGPPSHSSASACLNDRVREAAKRLQAALDGGHPFAKLNLAQLTLDAGQEDAALAHLTEEHLSWRVQRGRDTCAGCLQTRGEDTPMLTISGCIVARFCRADHKGWL